MNNLLYLYYNNLYFYNIHKTKTFTNLINIFINFVFFQELFMLNILNFNFKYCDSKHYKYEYCD